MWVQLQGVHSLSLIDGRHKKNTATTDDWRKTDSQFLVIYQPTHDCKWTAIIKEQPQANHTEKQHLTAAADANKWKTVFPAFQFRCLRFVRNANHH